MRCLYSFKTPPHKTHINYTGEKSNFTVGKPRRHQLNLQPRRDSNPSPTPSPLFLHSTAQPLGLCLTEEGIGQRSKKDRKKRN
ncbi:unnamed protein product, partial [Rangifer tarandus platyrhynchus]